MVSGGFRTAALIALACLGASCSHAADQRVAPSRPGAVTTGMAVAPVRRGALAARKINGIECVSLADVAAHLGLRTWPRQDHRGIIIVGRGTRAELEVDTRDVTINHLRVFLGNPVMSSRGELYVSRTDYETCLAPLMHPGAAVPVPPVPRVVVIDPGHGGRDFGKINERLGINEKTFTLDTAKRLKGLLEAAGYRVVLTRDSDRYVELPERTAIANAAHADLFVSIHFNALATDRTTSGVEVYTFAPQNQRSTDSWMPGKKDDSQPTAEAGNHYDAWNGLLAQSLHQSFVRELRTSDRGKKLMHLAVLRSLRCPGTLVECGFLTSDLEARRIANPAYRQKIAEALRDGIRDYAELVEQVRRSSGATATSARRRTSRSS